MKKRLLASLLSLCLLVGLFPTAALAAEDTADEAAVVCTELDGCIGDTHDEDCPLYVAPEEEPTDVPGELGKTPAEGEDDTTVIAPEQEDPVEEPTAVEQLAEMIAALPEYADVGEEDLGGIYAAQSAYDELSAEEQAQLAPGLRTKLEDLVELAAEIEEFLKNQAKEGIIEGAVYLADNSKTVEVVLAKTGTLQAIVESTEGYAQENVVSLTISTEPGAFLNYKDFSYIRTELPELKTLDISDADCLNDYDPTNPVEHEIPRNAMTGNTVLETVVLSQKVTSIAQAAFSGCIGLRGDLVIPNNITHLGKAAFGFWGSVYPSFESLTLSENMEVMEAGAFLRCKIKGTVTIPASVTYMGGDWTYGGVFQDTKLDGIVFEEGSKLEYLGSYSFSANSAMAGELKLPDSLTYIGGYAFSNCAALTGELKLPTKLESLGSNAFAGCTSLTGTVTVPGTVQTVGSSAFQSCTGLTGVIFEEGVAEISNSAFFGCTALTGITFNEGLTTIGDAAFRNCTSLTGTLTLPNSLQTIGKSAFQNCTGAFELALGTGLTSIGNSAFQGNIQMTGTLTFPEAMENIGSNAFSSCSSMVCENLAIPDGISTIGASTFKSCAKLTGTLTIPVSVTEIGNEAFRGTGFQTVTFSENMKTIGNSAFQDAASLTSIGAFPSGLESIGNNAFSSCTSLTGEIALPDSLESLGTSPFANAKITKLSYSGSKLKEFTQNNLTNLIALQALDLSGSSVEKLTSTSQFSTLTEVKLPGTLKELTLTNKRGLEDIDLTGCSSLTNVDLSNCAIDFSGGAPATWLESYNGTKTITGQNIILYATRGQTERSIELNGTFADDFTIKTKNGTDLSTSEKWSNFRSTYQNNTDTSKNWVTNNRLLSTFPVTRTPNYSTGVTTGSAGIQFITYSCNYSGNYPDLYDELNYQVTLTVGEGGGSTSEPSGTLTVVQANGSAINTANGLSKTYMDASFMLNAKIGNSFADPSKLSWSIYADAEGTKSDETSDKVLKRNENGLFEITGAGTAWVVATYEGSETPLNSAAVKIVVKPYTYNLNLKQAKSKTYGAEDPANFGYNTAVTANGKTEALQGMVFTRDAGEDVGTYQIYLYNPDELYLSVTSRNAQDFWSSYAEAAKAKFAQDNPNFTLSFGTNNVNLPSADSTGNFTINAKLLTQNVLLSAKNYDGTAEAQITTTTPVIGVLPADLENGVSVAITAYFDSADVNRDSEGAVIKQDGEVIVTLTGAKVQNYALPKGYTSGVESNNVTWTKSGEGENATITIKRDNLSAQISPLAISCYLEPLDKVYDGTTTATFESEEAFQKAFTGLCAADQEFIGTITAAFSDKNSGDDKIVTLSSEKIDFNNYKMPTFTASITPKPLSVTGLTASSKAYDGTVDAVISGTPAIDASGVLSGDEVSISNDGGELKGEFYDKNAGNKKSVVVSAGFGLAGAGAGNYYLQPASTMYADITPIPLTVTPDSGQYKSLGALDPTFTYTLSGLVESDKNTETGAALSGVVRGALSRVPGEDGGEYAFTLGSLTSTSNYDLVLAENSPKFVIQDTDATLNKISISAGTLSPAFNPEVESYTVKLANGVTEVPIVTAEATNSAAKIVVDEADDLTGNTTITVTAADGVTTKAYVISFSVAAPVSVTAVVVNANSGSSDGMIIATGAGGLGSYEFSLDGSAWQSGDTFDGKASGNYTLYVRDSEDHSNTAQCSVTVGTKEEGGTVISAPTTLTANPASPVIPYSAASLSITLTAGGVEDAAYRYYIYSGVGTINGNVLTVTAPGSVTVRAEAIKDGTASTESKSLTLSITKADSVSMIAVPQNVTSYGGKNGSIAVTASGGLGTYQYRIGNGSWGDDGTFSGLAAGTYTVSVRDAVDTANITSETITITQAEATDATAINEVLNALTLGDTSAVTESLALPSSETYGGTPVSISWTTSDPTVVAADGTVTRPSSSAGNKTVTLTATLTCGGISRTKTFEITVLAKAASSSSGGSSSGSTTYTVTTDSTKNGTVSVSPKNASKNTTVTITVKPNSGYELDDLTVTDKNGDTVKLTRKSDTQYTFTMPASKVTVEASFTKIEEQSKVSFVDVSTSAYYYDAVEWAVENGVTSGTSATTFSPNASCTRAQAVTFLWRAAGSPAPKSSVNPFTDVPASAYYYDAVLWAVEQGITAGTSATTFSPDATCTRGQIVTFLYRADGTATVGSNPFTDVADSAYYYDAVKWAVAEGVTAGTSATTFSPDASCTRAQIVTFLYRAYA